MSVKSKHRLEKIGSGDKENIAGPLPMVLRARSRMIVFPRRPLLMGILNINDDSFSGDGRLDEAWALARAAEMVAEGADIVDVGGESARTNRAAVSEEEEWNRIRRFVEKFEELAGASRPRDSGQLSPPLLSVNTWRRSVAARALGAGCDILNDMGALPDDGNAVLCAATGAALLIMHSRGEPKIAHSHVRHEDIMAGLDAFFVEKILLATRAGVAADQILLDPGIDFAKRAADNLRIYREMARLHRFGRPVLLPVSRKGVIGDVLGIDNPADRDAGTVACIVAGRLRGASIFRVHDVSAAWQTLRTLESVTL